MNSKNERFVPLLIIVSAYFTQSCSVEEMVPRCAQYTMCAWRADGWNSWRRSDWSIILCKNQYGHRQPIYTRRRGIHGLCFVYAARILLCVIYANMCACVCVLCVCLCVRACVHQKLFVDPVILLWHRLSLLP